MSDPFKEKYGKTSGIRIKPGARKRIDRLIKRRGMGDLADLFRSGVDVVEVAPEIIVALRYLADLLESRTRVRKIVPQPPRLVAQSKTKLNSLVLQGHTIRQAQEIIREDES